MLPGFPPLSRGAGCGWIAVFVLVPFGALIAWLVATSGHTPVDVKNCSVREESGARVVVDADLLNHAGAAVAQTTINVRVGVLGSLYVVNGGLPPGQWTHRTTTTYPTDLQRLYGARIEYLVGPVVDCFVQVVQYRDGTTWVSPRGRASL